MLKNKLHPLAVYRAIELRFSEIIPSSDVQEGITKFVSEPSESSEKVCVWINTRDYNVLDKLFYKLLQSYLEKHDRNSKNLFIELEIEWAKDYQSCLPDWKTNSIQKSHYFILQDWIDFLERKNLELELFEKNKIAMEVIGLTGRYNRFDTIQPVFHYIKQVLKKYDISPSEAKELVNDLRGAVSPNWNTNVIPHIINYLKEASDPRTKSDDVNNQFASIKDVLLFLQRYEFIANTTTPLDESIQESKFNLEFNNYLKDILNVEVDTNGEIKNWEQYLNEKTILDFLKHQKAFADKGYQRHLEKKKALHAYIEEKPVETTDSTDTSSKTKDLIEQEFNNIKDNCFKSEDDYNFFVELLTAFFELKPYSLPKNKIELKRGCKTKIATLFNPLHKLLRDKALKNDIEYLQIIKVLNHFSEETNDGIYKAITR